MFFINTQQGNHRKVFVFKKIVIKIPKNYHGLLANINEVYNYHKYKKQPDINKILCPIIFHSLFCFFIVMRKASPIFYENYYLKNSIINKFQNTNITHPVLNDMKINNFGLYKDKLVKIDYGNDYWLYNLGVDIKNIIITIILQLKQVVL